jgi:hypothetical protein
MTVGALISALENFDENTPVRIGMIQNFGSNFAMNIIDDIEEHTIEPFYGKDYKAVILTEGNQIGVVDYNDEIEDED